MSVREQGPHNLTLGELIEELEKVDPDHVCSVGFGEPHSDRGDYADLAFSPARNVTVGSMLAHARSALGATFEGYKGGDFTMGEWTDVLIGEWGDCGENIGSLLICFMLVGSIPKDTP